MGHRLHPREPSDIALTFSAQKLANIAQLPLQFGNQRPIVWSLASFPDFNIFCPVIQMIHLRNDFLPRVNKLLASGHIVVVHHVASLLAD